MAEISILHGRLGGVVFPVYYFPVLRILFDKKSLVMLVDHSFSTYGNFFEKLTFLPP